MAAQQGDREPAPFINHNYAWITPFVLDQSLEITNGDPCGHYKDPLPARGAPRPERITIGLAAATV
jgi:hypothetical protein